jgi:uncharacterized protein YoxC
MDYFYQQKLINEKNQLQRQLMEANHELNQLKAIVQEMTEILNAEPIEEGQRRVGRVQKNLGLDLDDPVVEPEKPLSRSRKGLGLDLDDPVGAVNMDMAQRGQLPEAATKRLLGTRPVTEDIQTPERAAEMKSEIKDWKKYVNRLDRRSNALWNAMYGKKATVSPATEPMEFSDSVDDLIAAKRELNDTKQQNKREIKSKRLYGKGGKVMRKPSKK